MEHLPKSAEDAADQGREWQSEHASIHKPAFKAKSATSSLQHNLSECHLGSMVGIPTFVSPNSLTACRQEES